MSVNTGEPKKKMIKTKVVNTLRYVFVRAAVFFRERGKDGFLFKELLKCCKMEEIVQSFFFKNQGTNKSFCPCTTSEASNQTQLIKSAQI